MKRIILLSVLALEGIGGILGGVLLAAAPNGYYMNMPVEIMHGVFPDFFIPGLILTGMGILNLAAFAAVFLKKNYDWVMAGLALVGFASLFRPPDQYFNIFTKAIFFIFICHKDQFDSVIKEVFTYCRSFHC